MASVVRPPFAGHWIEAELGNTGAWSVGVVWLNRESSAYCLHVGPQHCNAFGVMHGGAMATFADSQLCADPSYPTDAAPRTPTITLTVDYLAPVDVAAWLLLTGRVLRRTQTLIFTEAAVTVDGQLVARSNAIYRNFQHAGA